MHCNYHFFKRLETPLREKLVGKKLLACFSQEKDELVLGFGDQNDEFYIKTSVKSTFGGLYFSEEFHRAKRNSVDLFEELMDREVLEVLVFQNERAISIKLNDRKSLVLKMYGNRSNVLHFEGNDVKEIFNHNLKDDFNLKYADFSKQLSQTFEDFKNADNSPNKLFPTWGKIPKAYYEANKVDNQEANWKLVESINHMMETSKFYLIEFNDELHLSLLRFQKVIDEYEDPFTASNRFYVKKQQTGQLEKEKKSILKDLQKRLKQGKSYLLKSQSRLNALSSGLSNLEIGHLLMANLHQIAPQQKFVELNDFQTGKPVHIKLKKDLSAQKNAELYYKKAKKEKIEIEILEKNISQKEMEVLELEEEIEQVKSLESIKELRKTYKPETPKSEKAKKESPENLFKTFEVDSFKIWVGKNAKNNDLLTLKYAHKNDTWLHAKDVSGSHVIIKDQAGKNIPTKVLETAAGLAAWFSKRRTDSLVPVALTPKKFVRKVKGSPDGQVIVEKEEVILVDPIDPTELVHH
ncbi:NFACT RNA binding domain-containing protein [Jiulongibacter sp. NS-SX5]|uniref:NFACT RNA binding domain-containing protein n=1 Tax=Jiulongibacter sp. NS-SX5 TaxID=3463854 RepID=UPI00405A443F